MARIEMEALLDRYLKGEATSKEIELVESWLNNKVVHGDEWQLMGENEKERWLSNLYSEIAASAGVNSLNGTESRPARTLWPVLASVAASIAIFFAVYLLWPALQTRQNMLQLAVLNIPANQKKQVILADGSMIRLNSGSVLKYPLVFAGNKREVFLSGEAYFDIHHETSRPFIIHTGKVITTVLGTAFNIREDHQAHTVTVTVTRGKVSVANEGQALGVLIPNQQISFNTVNHLRIQKNVDAKMFIGWQESDIHFNDITFAEATLQLEQRFKVQIDFANEKVKNRRFTGTALKGENLDNILKVICAFNNASYKTNADGSITIYSDSRMQ